jgi:hypothetical protein
MDWSGVVLTQCCKAWWSKGSNRAEQNSLARACLLALHHLWMFCRVRTHMRTRMSERFANIMLADKEADAVIR